MSEELRKFFKRDHSNLIKFLNCPSQYKQTLHTIVNKEMKNFDLVLIFPCKSSWKFDKKKECDDILNNWKMTFQASNNKEKYFLNLLDDDLNPIESLYSKKELWLKFFGHSNSLYARASRAIINHTPIEEYQLRFFPQEEFKCLCSQYPIKIRQYIFHECRRFNNY